MSILFPFYFLRENLRSADQSSRPPIGALWKHKSHSCNWQRTRDMDRCYYTPDAHRDELFHWQPGHGRCHHWTFLHSVSISSSRPAALGASKVHVPVLSLRSNSQRERLNLHTDCHRHWSAQSNSESFKGSIVEARIENHHRSHMDYGAVAGSSDELRTASRRLDVWIRHQWVLTHFSVGIFFRFLHLLTRKRSNGNNLNLCP